MNYYKIKYTINVSTGSGYANIEHFEVIVAKEPIEAINKISRRFSEGKYFTLVDITRIE